MKKLATTVNMRMEKGKGVAAPISIRPGAVLHRSGVRGGGDETVADDLAENYGERSDGADSSPYAPPVCRLSSRHATSKYDFVKVKVWLGDNCDHYYVFSRFLLCRMLTVTKIPNHVAIKMALELKKLLIDNSLLDVSQSDLEANLFKLMERRGYGEEYINRYKMMTRFHHQRVPLVILVCGTACVGKSTIATQLAQRLNLPNVLQTDMVYELLRTATEAPLSSTPVWARSFNSSEELISEFCRECRIVRQGLAGDLKKAMKDGKPIIIEGIHLDPSIYLIDNINKSSAEVSAESKDGNLLNVSWNGTNESKVENKGESTLRSQVQIMGNSLNLEHVAADSSRPGNEVSGSSRSVENSGKTDGKSNKTPNDNKSTKKGKAEPEPIIVPIVLKMAEFDHKSLLEEWISSRTFGKEGLGEDKEQLIRNLKTIQGYLCSYKGQGLHVVNVSATAFSQTLDLLHNYLLQCIEQGISSASSSDNRQPTGENRGQ
ncbi:hypothetical protein MLD38_010879 [Melastoma candidum]|uniref:Uncharacterized protein n=1 Tax=Melastoma candidum TaxID=119954 RepID=A0ACB9R4S0_9MYRT|nr:hypothetical protein MLD38_010879 [Melastoma candidum]